MIGRFTVNHRQFGVTQRRSRSVRQNNVGERALVFLKSKDRNVVLKPEKRQAVSSLQNGEDILAVLPTGFGKSINFTVFGIAKRESGTSSCVLNLPVEKHSFGPGSATGRSLYRSRTHC